MAYSYMVEIQFLGFRFSGWQKQTNAKSVSEMVERSIQFVLKHDNFKVHGVGRTDAKVSALSYYFQLITSEELPENFFVDFKKYLPPDILALSIKDLPNGYNLIGAPKIKTYRYFFTEGNDRPSPFSAPFLVHFESLNIDEMKKAAKLFVGEQDFKAFCYKPSKESKTIRSVISCDVLKNDFHQGAFFPEESYMLEVKASGFLRYQVRLMMSALCKIGVGELQPEDLVELLKGKERPEGLQPAPSSGLLLYSTEFL